MLLLYSSLPSEHGDTCHRRYARGFASYWEQGRYEAERLPTRQKLAALSEAAADRVLAQFTPGAAYDFVRALLPDLRRDAGLNPKISFEDFVLGRGHDRIKRLQAAEDALARGPGACLRFAAERAAERASTEELGIPDPADAAAYLRAHHWHHLLLEDLGVAEA